MPFIEVIEAKFTDTGQNQLEMVLKKCFLLRFLIYKSSHVKNKAISTTM